MNDGVKKMKWEHIGVKVWYACPYCGYEIAMPKKYKAQDLPILCPHCLRFIY